MLLHMKNVADRGSNKLRGINKLYEHRLSISFKSLFALCRMQESFKDGTSTSAGNIDVRKVEYKCLSTVDTSNAPLFLHLFI